MKNGKQYPIYLQTGGRTNTAKLQAQIDTNTGTLNNVLIINGGSGYNESTKLKITGSAQIKPIITNGSITYIDILNRGSGYTQNPVITIE